MAKKSTDTAQHKNPVLTKSRGEVSEWLKTRLEMGRGIVSKEIRFEIDLDNLYKEEEKWPAVPANFARWGFPKGENRDSTPLVQAKALLLRSI